MRAHILLICFASSVALIGCSFDPPDRPSAPVDASQDVKGRPDVIADVPQPPRDMWRDVRVDVVPDVVPDVRDAQQDPQPDLVDEVPDVYVPNVAVCDNVQVDLNQDAQNCGACGVACDPDYGVCDDGACGCAPEGMKACLPNGKCEDVQISAVHCGDCGTTCGAGAWCREGQCECRRGLTSCNGACVDLGVDPANCGQCGVSCGGDACRQGSCRGSSSCPLVEGRCRVNDADGVACLPESQFDNPLYCREDFLVNSCGRRCRGDQVCLTPSLFMKRECFDFRPALGCTSCNNCDDCTFREFCDDDLSPPNTAYCVKK